ncbi:MAG: DnaD domain protein [Bacilli bacterium]|jgi:DNA replication protein|nr:DnaD domain protein [Bacilli bacterium]MDD3069342.1 DnaD domain protein [Bacilli bacterium]MDD3841222.1 DnaD domain protein [Bacilli bacterium]
MHKKNMVSEAIDFRFLLMENYKKLKINEKELVTLFMIDHFITLGNPFVTADLLSLKMSLDVKEIDKTLVSLLTRGFIEYIAQGKKTITTLNPLKTKLYREFQISLTKEDEVKASKEVETELNNIFQEFSKMLGRSLAPVEISKIREWVSYGYSDELIINALKEVLSKGKKSLRSVDKILLIWSSRDDRENEGVSLKSEEWNKSLEETIRIAKTPWIDKNDD